jgi:hypothetical protein
LNDRNGGKDGGAAGGPPNPAGRGWSIARDSLLSAATPRPNLPELTAVHQRLNMSFFLGCYPLTVLSISASISFGAYT